MSELDMLQRKPPPYLIEGILHCGSAAVLISAPGVGKTFLALDMALSVAAGIPWHGLVTVQSPVLYILSEGGGSISTRQHAWRKAHARTPGERIGVGLWFWDRDIQLATDAGRMEINAALLEMQTQHGAMPQLIVVDTLARCFVGFDENAAQDMGRFIAGVDMLRRTGAAVLILHHEGHRQRDKSGNEVGTRRERGSSSLRGAVDTMMALERRSSSRGDMACTLTCSKQRDSVEFDPIYLHMPMVELDTFDDDGKQMWSRVVAYDDHSEVEMPVDMSEKWKAALLVLERSYPDGATYTEWRDDSGMSQRTFDRMRLGTQRRGLVGYRETDKRYYLIPQAEE